MRLTNESIRQLMTDYYFNMLGDTTLSKEEVRRAVDSVTSDVNFEEFDFNICFNTDDILNQICEDWRYLVFSAMKEIVYEHINEILKRNNISPIYPLLSY